MGTKHDIYQSLIRNQTFLLADRQLCMSLLFLCIVIASISLSIKGFLLSFFLFCLGYTALYLMQLNDPLLFKVYMRNIRYKENYLAHGNIFTTGYRK